MSERSEVFPKSGQMPTGEEFHQYVARSVAELGVTSYAIAKAIPGNNNLNIVREIETGKQINPRASTMSQIFKAIEDLKKERAQRDRDGE
ncbi:hypothetical protein [Phaeobacter gallaeciensis]|uniref:hypothetical protein n=1 Tax=Phaeobacter gallaeciensis TaxID=60890 RepID=UPI0003D6D616|nr:hypothetical protein [Phaeobacter gallaeciensis]AHD12161.1 hypothetical protein Gal_04457 [Phaeobacter gallaeciensis DSM 26640]ATE95345.1 hypothetical protein PhaeoP11_04361 [Phaeobacter gallaeciensis]